MDEIKSNELNKLLKDLNGIEAREDVIQWQFRGFHFWPLFKIKLYWYQGLKASPSRKLLLNQIWNYLRIGLYDFLYLLLSLHHIRKADFVISSNISNRRFKINGKFFDYYVDPIAEEFRSTGKNVVQFEINPQDVPYQSKSPTYSQSVNLNFIRKIVFLFAKIYVPPKLIRFLNTEVVHRCKPLEISPQFVTSIAQNIWAEYLYSKLIRLILKVIKPKSVFGVCYYSRWGEIYACHQLGINYIDIQHGAQGQAQPAYSYWKNTYNTLPDIYWVWSKDEETNINAWRGRTFVGLNPFQRMLGHQPRILRDESEKLSAWHDPSQVGVTVTLQPGVPFEYLTELHKNPQFYFFIKFHPLMNNLEKENVDKALAQNPIKNFEYKFSSASPLQACLAASQLHLTMDSFAVSEAAEWGLNSVCLGAHSVVLFENYVRTGKVHYLNNFKIFSTFATPLINRPQFPIHPSIPDLKFFG